MPDTKQLVLFLLVPVVFTFARGPRARTVATVALTVGAASAFIGVVQYGLLNYDNLGRRPQGTLSHWMTYSGTLMLVICGSVARLLFDQRDRAWAALVMPALVVALGLTFTRSAWVGVFAGVGVLFLLKDRRLIGVLPLVAALLVALAPAAITTPGLLDVRHERSRPTAIAWRCSKPAAPSSRDHPLTGVGPDMVRLVYPRYRVPWAVEPTNAHLHNVPVQIAAERGLPALAAWVWFIVAVCARPVAQPAAYAHPGPGRRRPGIGGGDAGRRPLRIQLRRLGVPDALPGVRHAAAAPPIATAGCRDPG